MKETLRDKIAIAYMQSILSSPERFEEYADEDNIMEGISRDAYLMADTMVESRKAE
jgi:hypothetical protein